MQKNTTSIGIIALGLVAHIACSSDKKAQTGNVNVKSSHLEAANANGNGSSNAVTAPASAPAPAPDTVAASAPASAPSADIAKALATILGSSSGTGGLGGLATTLGASGFSTAQIGKFLGTPIGSAIFTQILSNPALSAETGIPKDVLATIAKQSQLVSDVLQNPKIAAVLDKGLAKLMAEDPSLVSKILSVVAGGAGGAISLPGIATLPSTANGSGS
jgi:hypothetical protein